MYLRYFIFGLSLLFAEASQISIFSPPGGLEERAGFRNVWKWDFFGEFRRRSIFDRDFGSKSVRLLGRGNSLHSGDQRVHFEVSISRQRPRDFRQFLFGRDYEAGVTTRADCLPICRAGFAMADPVLSLPTHLLAWGMCGIFADFGLC